MTSAVRASFRQRPSYRAQILGILGLMWVGAVVLVSRLATGVAEPPPLFLVFWLAVLGWNSYWLLFRVAIQVDLTDDRLEWSAPLRRGSVALPDLTAVAPLRIGAKVYQFRSVHERPVVVLGRKGLLGFTAAVQDAAPQITVTLTWLARTSERLPGRTGFRR